MRRFWLWVARWLIRRPPDAAREGEWRCAVCGAPLPSPLHPTNFQVERMAPRSQEEEWAGLPVQVASVEYFCDRECAIRKYPFVKKRRGRVDG